MASNVDREDVIRGPCLVDNCDCEEFELDEKSQFCGYCNDAPTKHKRIGKRISQSKPTCIVHVKINQGRAIHVMR